MPTRSALAGAATTAVVVAALGNPAAVSAARDADDQALGLTLTGFASWEDVADRPADVVATVAVRLGVTLVLVVLLCGLAGRARARSAAFLGAWGALAVAAATGGALAYVHQVAVVLDGRTPDATYRDGLVLATNAGAAFGTWTGWLVGAAVALATRPATAVIGTEDIRRTATTTASQRITEPPPPWWAPTRDAGDDTIRPGPTAFPPGGLGHEVRDRAAGAVPPSPSPSPADEQRVADADATVAMTTASGDAHPSDPDATAVAPRSDGGDEHADATASLPAESDRTLPLPLPRPPD